MGGVVAAVVFIATLVLSLGHRRRRAGRSARDRGDPRRVLASLSASLARGVRAGMTPAESIMSGAGRFEGVVGEQLGVVAVHLQRGVSVEESLRMWARDADTGSRRGISARPRRRRGPDPSDIELLGDAITFSSAHGAGQAEALEGVASALLDRSELDEELRALTAQGSASTIMLCSLPVVGTAMMAAVAPEALGVLFGSRVGLGCLTAAVVLDSAALAISRRLTASVHR